MTRICVVLVTILSLVGSAHAQWKLAPAVSVKAYGAVGDGKAVTHAAATGGNSTLVDIDDKPWTPADVGKTLVFYNATYSPGLTTTIQSFTDSAHIVLAAAPVSSTTGIAVWGTDDTAAIQNAIGAIAQPPNTPNTSGASALYFPAGIYLIGGLAANTVNNCSTANCITSSGNTVTMTATNHGFTTGQWIQVAGVANALFNGVYQITVTGVNTFTYYDPNISGNVSSSGGTSSISNSLVFTNAAGLHVYGDGPGSAASLGNYNINAQPGGGTTLVWTGPVGGAVGCQSNTGSPPAGLNNATTNCTAAENYMMKLSGQFILENINLQGSRRASHLLVIGGGDTSNSFSFNIKNLFGGYATQYGLVIGGTNTDQAASFGEAYFENLSLAYSGLVNSALAESDPTCGGKIFVRYGNGNYQKQWNTGWIGGSNDVDGCHHIYWYSGNIATFNNIYFAPLSANGTSHSSMYYAATAGVNHTFDNIYDENGWFLHTAGGDQFSMRQIQTRINNAPTAPPHVGAVFDNSVAIDLNGWSTAGLPLIFKGGGRISRKQVSLGSLGSFPIYPFTLCGGANCITRAGSDVTVTTTTTHSYLAGDYVTLADVADATYDGTFVVNAPITGTTFHVTNANAVGASTQGGTVSLACCIIASTATGLIPQDAHPFIPYTQNDAGISTVSVLAAAVNNLANKNTITMIPAPLSGGVGSSMPATIPAGYHFLDFRGGNPTFLGGPFQWGTNSNAAKLGINNAATHAPQGFLEIAQTTSDDVMMYFYGASGTQRYQWNIGHSLGTVSHELAVTDNLWSLSSGAVVYFLANKSATTITIGQPAWTVDLSEAATVKTPTENVTTALQWNGQPTFVYVTSDFTTAANTNLQNITGLTWTMPATNAVNLPFDCYFQFSQATGTAAVSFGIQDVTTAPTQINANGTMATSATAVAFGPGVQALNTTTATAILTRTPSATATIFPAEIHGVIEQPSGPASAINIMVKTATSGDAVTVKRGSYCRIGPK